MLSGFATPMLALLAAISTAPGDTVVTTIRVDSARHEIVLTAGPWRRAPMDHDMMAMPMEHHVAAATTFTWPVDGWVRSLRFRARTRDGHDVPRTALHHLAVVNLGRRDLLYQVPERMFEMGGETADIVLPGSIAIPVTAGTPMVLTIAWGSDGHDAMSEVAVELTMDWLPIGRTLQPVSAFPVTMQVTTFAGQTTFDLPPGESSRGTSYSMPMGGRILAAGGHLHDHGTGILLRDISLAESNPVLSLSSQRDAADRVTGIERVTPGLTGPGLPLYAGHRYQLEGRYANSTGATIPGGGMAFLVMMYAPDRPADWPAADPRAPSWRRFLELVGMPDLPP